MRFAIALGLLLLPLLANGQELKRLEFTRLIAHWDAYGDRAAYLSFVDEAQPEVAQVGFYGAHFWSLAHTPHGKGYPAHFPLKGLQEQGQWFADLNAELHKRQVKVVGHFNLKFLVGDPESPEGPRGFFKFYRELWDEKELGPKPIADPVALLEKDKDGKPISIANYSIGGMKEYWGCLNNPHWRTVLKAWVKRGIERGVDGYVANYFYRNNCLCEHCTGGFKTYLGARFTPEKLKSELGIADLANHRFEEIVSWHDPAQSTPLKREMLRFSQIANKRAYDEVFLEHGRKLKPDLIVAQWNHLGDFNQINGDERCLLPGDLWGKGEDYLWYSTGDAASSTELAVGFLGEATLQARYIRGAFDDKPYTLGKYESTRIRTAIGELAANGGAPMGFYTRFTDPAARKEIARYYQFLKKHDAIYRGNRPHSDFLLLFPRTQVHAGNVKAVEAFKKLGRELLDQHVLFDVSPDDQVAETTRETYQQVFDPSKYDTLPDLRESRPRFAAPKTVRISASRPANEKGAIHLHLVNYNRQEPEQKRSPGSGIVDEKPIATPEIAASCPLPKDWLRVQVRFATPEMPDFVEVPVAVENGIATFKVPSLLVYGVIELKKLD